MSKPFALATRSTVAGFAILALGAPAAVAATAGDATPAPSTSAAPGGTAGKPTDTAKPTLSKGATPTDPKPAPTTTPANVPAKPLTKSVKPDGGMFLGDQDAGDKVTNTVRKGGHYRIAAYCNLGAPTDLRSPVMDIAAPSSLGTIWVAKATVKDSAAPGSYTITGKCGTQPMTWSVSVVGDTAQVRHGKTVAAQRAVSKKPLAAVKPAGRIETGGGATTQS